MYSRHGENEKSARANRIHWNKDRKRSQKSAADKIEARQEGRRQRHGARQDIAKMLCQHIDECCD